MKKWTTNAAWLTIGSWIGIGLGAEHYYGTITLRRSWGKKGNKEWQVQKKLTKSEAIELNKKEGTSSFFRYKPGMLTERFNTEAEMVEYAIALFREKVQKKYPDVKYLVLGTTGVIDPQPIIVGDGSKEVTMVNNFAARAEKIGYFDSPKEMEEINKRWEKLAIRMGYLHPDFGKK